MRDDAPIVGQRFTCCECGRDMIALTETKAAALCNMCVFFPGWFRHPAVRALLDPRHDGVEVCDRNPGAIACP